MNDNETLTFEGKEYVSPTVSRDEQLSFVDNLRQTSADNIDRINQDTQALGSQVDPMYGGLSKGTAFEQRYVTPQLNNIVSTLKATAQQTALNQALTNLQNQYTQRYNEAYRNAKINEYNAAQAAANSSTSDTDDGDIETTGYNLSGSTSVPGVSGGYTIANIVSADEDGNITSDGYTYVPYGSTDNYTITNKDLTSDTTSSSSAKTQSVADLLNAGINNLNYYN